MEKERGQARLIALLPFFAHLAETQVFACSLFDVYIHLHKLLNAFCLDEIHIYRSPGSHLPLPSNEKKERTGK